MAYECLCEKSFYSEFDRLAKERQTAVMKKIRQIEQDPSRFDFLKNTDRMQKARVGNLRIIFKVDEGKILLYSVAKRDVAYRQI